MTDVLFVAVVIAFFAVAILFVRGCELILGRHSAIDDGPGR
jgi:hypothetical protein